MEERGAFHDTTGRWWYIWVRWHVYAPHAFVAFQQEVAYVPKYFMGNGRVCWMQFVNTAEKKKQTTVLAWERDKLHAAYKTQET